MAKSWGFLVALFVAAAVLTAGMYVLIVWLLPTPSEATALVFAPALFAAMSALGSLFVILEMRADRLDRNRPTVVIDFVIDRNDIIQMVIRNIGSGVARQVAFKFDPIPIELRGQEVTDFALFHRPIPALGPNSEIRSTFHTYTSLINQDIPHAFVATVTYKGDGNRTYEDTFHFDLDQHYNLLEAPKTVDDHLKDVAAEVKKIADAVSQMNTRQVNAQILQQMKARQKEQTKQMNNTDGPPSKMNGSRWRLVRELLK